MYPRFGPSTSSAVMISRSRGREFRMTGGQCEPPAGPVIGDPDVLGLDQEALPHLVDMSPDRGLHLDGVPGHEQVEGEEGPTVGGSVAGDHGVPGLAGDRGPRHVSRALRQRVAGYSFEDHRVETHPGHGEAGEFGALCGDLLGVVLEDLLLEALDLFDFRQICALGLEEATELGVGRGLDPGVEQIGAKQLPTQVAEDEQPTPDQSPTENLDVATHRVRLKARQSQYAAGV